MPEKGDQTPTLQEDIIYRPKDQLQLFHNELVNDEVVRISNAVECAPFRKFGLYVYAFYGTGATDATLHIEVEFLDRWTGQWYNYKQGLFAALYYEDADAAKIIYECFTGDVLGRAMRVKLTGDTVDANNYFTVSIGTDFWN